MEFDNKTILIIGLILGAICAMTYHYEQIALAIVSGLVGYLSKDSNITINKQTEHDEIEKT
ncbi:hypothetical protein [Methanobrevibacter sp.]|uniref:hypothetical protein n=1 Tax=Methanobrevibacter sp. TaxID=66852 RepID=UPI0026E0F22D|nr:hypothetical protein [Methanobrevibacter sp.]MDO5824663.1 hypothetical protein [Methanobrevibacter sp.]